MIIDIIYFRFLYCLENIPGSVHFFRFDEAENVILIFNTIQRIKLSRNDNFQVNSPPCHVFATNFLNIYFANTLKITTLNITMNRPHTHLNKTTWHILILAKSLLDCQFQFWGLKCTIKPINSSLIYFELTLNICIKTYIHFETFNYRIWISLLKPHISHVGQRSIKRRMWCACRYDFWAHEPPKYRHGYNMHRFKTQNVTIYIIIAAI